MSQQVQYHKQRRGNFQTVIADSYSIEPDRQYGGFKIYGWGVYESGVLEGQTKKFFIESVETLEEAMEAYPSAEQGYRSAHNSFNHLPCREDPTPGGMYLDDIKEGKS